MFITTWATAIFKAINKYPGAAIAVTFALFEMAGESP